MAEHLYPSLETPPPAAHHASIALLVGCPGSGTGALARLIGSHPGVAVPGDGWELGGSGGDEDSDRRTADHAGDELASRLSTEAVAQQGEAGLLLVHEPRAALQVPFARAVFPGAMIVHLVRDGRDVARALEPALGGASWPAPRPPGWRELLERTDGLVRCALAWKETIEILLADLDGVPHLTIRYEDLIADPKRCRQRVLFHLGLDASHDDGAAWATVAGEEGQLTAVERQDGLEVIDDLLAGTLERLGYPARRSRTARSQELALPRWARFEQRRLARLLSEREARAEAVERRTAELEWQLRSRQARDEQLRRAGASLDRALLGLAAVRASRGWRLLRALARLARPSVAGASPHDPLEETMRRIERVRSTLTADTGRSRGGGPGES